MLLAVVQGVKNKAGNLIMQPWSHVASKLVQHSSVCHLKDIGIKKNRKQKREIRYCLDSVSYRESSKGHQKKTDVIA